MDKLVLIDGNSIMNRAFYGIMGSKMLTTKDGKYTNAVYGFLAILFNIIDDIKPEYIAVAFDLKGKLKRKELFEGYKANRHGMPDELAEQMPVIKDVLRAMNIDIIEKEGYEGDDILGTLAKYGEKQGLEVTILSGDRDTFQLASDNITIRIPRTKAGKTETENYNRAKVLEATDTEKPEDTTPSDSAQETPSTSGKQEIDPSTGKDKYQTDPVPDGKPAPAEPEDAEVDTSTKYTCTISITCKTILDNMDKVKESKKESFLPMASFLTRPR